MKTLRSFLQGQWVEGSGSPRSLHNAVTGEAIAEVSTAGLDLGASLAWARTTGGPTLRSMSFAERAGVLKKLSEICYAHRDELIELSRENYGATRGDAKFDIDGASGTLAYYASVGRKLGDRTFLLDGDSEELLRSPRFVGQHVQVPRRGVAIHINAFNFPCWGMAEKAATALLAGMPILVKPATATSIVTARLVELWDEAGVLPEGAVSLLTGSVGDLLDHVGPQDCVAFTGGSETARAVRGHPAVVAQNVRVNIEADSLNASILGPDVEPGSDTWWMWVNDVARDMTQKAGQKCTAVRRILVPEAVVDDAIEALSDKLAAAVTGDPTQRETSVGPLSTASQQRDILAGLDALGKQSTAVFVGEGAPETGYFVAPRLYRNDHGVDAEFVNDHEVFGPVATILTWAGDANTCVDIVARGGGGLVCAVYSNDRKWSREVVLGLAPWHGRIVWGSKKIHDQSAGPGTVLPGFVHGGPGKAGGGEELGGLRGLAFYMQRTAIQGDRGLLDKIL